MEPPTPQSAYGTPLGPTPRRRRALSPKLRRSPYTVIDVSINDGADHAELIDRLKEQDGIIQELRETNTQLEETLITSFNESVVVQTSSKISKDETRIYKRDCDMLNGEVSALKNALRSHQHEKQTEFLRRQKLEEDVKKKQAEIDTLQEEVSHLKDVLDELQKKVSDRDQEIRCLNNEFDDKRKEFQAEQERLRKEIAVKETALRKADNRAQSLRAELDLEVKSSCTLHKELSQKKQQIEQLLKNSKPGSDSFEEQRKSILEHQVLTEIRTLSNQLSSAPCTPRRETELCEEIGGLKSSMRQQDNRYQELKEQHAALQKELSEKSLELQKLQTAFSELEGNQGVAHRYLIEENEKIKQQKAALRCELIQVQRANRDLKLEVEKSVTSINILEETRKEMTEFKSMYEAEAKKLEEMTQDSLQLKNEIAEKDAEIARLKEELGKSESEVTELRQELDKRIANYKIQTTLLVELDGQCDRYRKRELREKASAAKLKEDMENLSKLYREAQAAVENKRATDSELELLRGENRRLEGKYRLLMEELQEAHSDYRNQLAQMARQINDAKQQALNGSQDHEQHCHVAVELKRQASQKDAELRSLKRRVSEMENSYKALEEQVSEVRTREITANQENADLRKGLADAIEKIEKFKREADDAKEISDALAEQLSECNDKLGKLEDDYAEVEQALEEKERLATYLQSQINVKQLPKVGRRSTLLRTISDASSISNHSTASNTTSVTEEPVEVEEVIELENQLSQLKRERDQKAQMLQDMKRMPPPTGRPEPSAPPRTPLSVNNGRANTIASSTPSTSLAVGTMRHEIPHHWKDLRHISLSSMRCAVCFSGVPRFGKARRCTHCGVIVHAHCAVRVVKTCGLPDQYANFYMEKHTVPEGRMNGWIRLYRDSVGSREWKSAWAMMDEKALSFYDHDSVQDLSNPFFKIDFSKDSFVVRAGGSAPSDADEMPLAACVIHLRMSNSNVYILPPSIPSAKRWTEVLQAAQTARMMLTRKPSSFSEQSCMLTLQAPSNLTIHQVTFVDEYMLIAAASGLFFTNSSAPRLPVRIGGIDSAQAIEVISDINIVAFITGTQRNLAIIPLSMLRNQMKCHQPTIRPDVLQAISHVHVLGYHEVKGQRYLCAADMTKINILKYHASKDMFVPFHKMDTAEPVMFFQNAHGRFFFGADGFYRIDFSDSAPRASSVVPAHIADYPLAVLPIGTEELLLAYQNHGLFVYLNGSKSRDMTVEWEQMPMEFAFTAPYLYILHYDSIEIVQVSEKNERNQPAIMEEREVYACQNAHVIGRRPNGDIIIAISDNTSVEVHRFNATTQKRVMKRKGISLASFHDKRSKLT